jgi:two-component system cell cycle sensor histidine kinase/response regulator CckA
VRSLEMIGVDSLTAVDGLDALAVLALRAADIDLVLLDLTMPRLGGRETFRRLRALYPDIPVVLTSGYSEEEATMEFADGALADFLEKPYGPKDIAACVRRLLATVAAPTPGAG